jgi:hypothetical protein
MLYSTFASLVKKKIQQERIFDPLLFGISL